MQLTVRCLVPREELFEQLRRRFRAIKDRPLRRARKRRLVATLFETDRWIDLCCLAQCRKVIASDPYGLKNQILTEWCDGIRNGNGGVLRWDGETKQFFKTTFRRAALRLRRRLDVTGGTSMLPPSDHREPPPDSRELSRETLEEVQRAIRQLTSPRLREVAERKLLRGQSHKAMAGELQVTEETVRARWSRARRQLEGLLRARLSPRT